MKFTAALLLISILAVVGCDKLSVSPSETKPDQNPQPVSSLAKLFQKQADLKPEVAPPREANLILNGTVIPVTLKETRKDNSIVYQWLVDDAEESGKPAEAESEKYFSTADVFSFSATAHEQYDPAINLIKYPLNVGDSWDWAGEVIVGKTRRKATAKVTTSADPLNLPNDKISALLVKVDLVYGGTANPAARELKFWFKPGEGLIRRELWASSTREPRSATNKSSE